jgi:hypothetical protein
MERMSDLCVRLVRYVKIGMDMKHISKFYMEWLFAVGNYKYGGA